MDRAGGSGVPRGERLPLVVFLHGYQAVEEFYYVAWIEHLVKRGAVVLYPTWQHRTSRLGGLTRNAVTGVETGMRWLLDEGVAVDPARVIFIGHSGGATLAVNLGVLAAQAKRYFEELYFQGARTQGRPGDVAFAHPWVVPQDPTDAPG